MKTIVHGPSEDTDLFDMVTGVFDGDSIASYLSILCLEYAPQTSIDPTKENCFTLEKTRSTWYPRNSMTDADPT